MALRLTNGAVFLHIPKTGGNWVREVLEEAGLSAGEVGHKHADADRVLLDPYLTAGPIRRVAWWARGGPPTLDPPFMFCFVRHPLTWYPSWFRYMSRRGWNQWPLRRGPYDWHPCHELNATASLGFDEFVDKALEAAPGYLTRLASWYTRRGVGFVGRQERLLDDTIEALGRMELAFDESAIRKRAPVNTSGGAGFEAQWEPTLRDRVLRAEAAYLRRFGYDDEPLAGG